MDTNIHTYYKLLTDSMPMDPWAGGGGGVAYAYIYIYIDIDIDIDIFFGYSVRYYMF